MAPSPPPALAPLLLLLLALPAELMPMPMPGAPMPVLQPESDPGVQVMERFALRMFNVRCNCDSYYRSKLLSAQTQVVEGIKYILKMEMAKTQCRKEKGKELPTCNVENCAFAPEREQQRQICNFEIWSRPWLNEMKLMNMTCKPS